MNGRERPRGLPPNVSPPKERRPMGDSRNGSGIAPGSGGMTRAEKFEDEKRRVIQSCFSKQDADGSALESYITHIRITEDAAYPSTPPPPNSPPENKKPRLIIVSVRKSGRVRMHKARENNDGSFSIGKTWMLDDLSRIQTYEHMPTSNPADQQQKMWASNVGFLVTITKGYYWQAATSKERDFFIGSLVKIYKKYTGGKVPELLGFDPRDRDTIAGFVSPSQPPGPSPGARVPPPARQDGAGPRPRSPQTKSERSKSPYTNRLPSRDGPPKEPRRQPSREQFLRGRPSQDDVQRARPQFSPGKIPPQQGSRGDPLSKPPDPNTAVESPVPSPLQTTQAPRTRAPGISPAPNPLSSSTGNQPRPQFNYENGFRQARVQHPTDNGRFTSGSEPLKNQPPPSEPPQGPIPRRPIVAAKGSFEDQSSQSEDKFVTPLSTPDPRKLETRQPSRGSEKSVAGLEPSTTQRNVPFSLRPGSGDFTNVVKPITPAADTSKQSTKPSSPEGDESPIVPEPSDIPKMLSSPISPITSADSPAAAPDKEEGETHRPGLGPMVKKKPAAELASTLRKAANAYGAFKPRAGGAADRLLADKKKSEDKSDSTPGVFPGSLKRGMTNDSMMSTATDSSAKGIKEPTPAAPPVSPPVAPPTNEVPKVQVTEPAPQAEAEKVIPKDVTPESPPSKSVTSQGERRRQRRPDNTTKYCTALGIDPALLEGKGAYFDDILTDIGWDGKLSEDKRIEDLEADVRREIGRVQASSWLGHLELQEGKVDQLARLFDKTIAECDELDGLLMLYAHELNTLADDVAYIEAQSQGLQVQTANQKLLQNELQNLLKTISISSSDLRPLREASLSSPDGIQDAELSLSTLYKAMVTIDPDIRTNQKRLADSSGDRGGVGVYANTEVGQMRAVKEKQGEYRNEAQQFLQRLKQYMGLSFKIAEQKTTDAVASSRKPSGGSTKIEPGAHGPARQELWMYNALMLFAREVSEPQWAGIINLYQQQMKKPYQNEFRDNTMAWKREARKPTGDEQELLFTHQEKDREGEVLTTAARKLTVRRGKTVRVPGAVRSPAVDKADGKIEPYEAFAKSLDDTTQLLAEEQNFVVRFFHLNSLSSADFPDLIAGARPEDRRPPKVSVNESYDPDRDMAKRVEQVMDEIFSPWVTDIQNLADWALNGDPLQGVGVLFSMERKLSAYDETNQEFIVRNLQKIHSRFMGLFNRFVDEQIRAIEETKVKVKKRKGVISFMKTFPLFSATIENMITLPSQETYDIRFSVNDAYEKINRAMWDSLKFIAKEAPGQQAAPSGAIGDPEDKEALNYHILLIENMNHYIEEVEARDNLILTEWQDRAQHDLREHLRLYTDAVIRRPLGKLLDFIESTETLIQTAATPSDVALRPSHSRIIVKKLLTSYDLKELRRGVDALKKRVEKHFGDADDPGLTRSLVVKVLKECEIRYSDVHDRMRHIIAQVYEGQMELEWRKEEAVAMFRR
ncbi:hypothetical protein FQN55_006958 [Onygenales sp. PD_40]|nr:hypothetical protein FQN55_006958 [Onygenales sp. PD_40]